MILLAIQNRASHFDGSGAIFISAIMNPHFDSNVSNGVHSTEVIKQSAMICCDRFFLFLCLSFHVSFCRAKMFGAVNFCTVFRLLPHTLTNDLITSFILYYDYGVCPPQAIHIHICMNIVIVLPISRSVFFSLSISLLLAFSAHFRLSFISMHNYYY